MAPTGSSPKSTCRLAVPKSAIEMINNALGTYKDFQGDIEYIDTYPKTPPSAK